MMTMQKLITLRGNAPDVGGENHAQDTGNLQTKVIAVLWAGGRDITEIII
jgi:hypothetical protein